MNLGTKLFIYMILFLNCEENVKTTSQFHSFLEVECMKDTCTTIENNSFEKVLRVLRVRRQDPIVQPDWTADDGIGNLFKDYNVRVTDRKLQETEALREIIQETIDEDTYVVELNESDFQNSESDMESNPEPVPEDNSGTQFEQLFVPEPQSEPEPVIEPEPITEPEPVVEPETVTEPEAIAEPEPEPITEPKPEPIFFPEPKPEPIFVPEPKSEPEPASPPAPQNQPKPQWKPKFLPEFKWKPMVVHKPKQKPKKINKLSAITPFGFFKKTASYDQVSSTFGKWWEKVCVQPWCKSGSKMKSIFI